jgi:TolA-binding protein
VGDFVQCAQTCRNFIQIFPTNSLAKNVHLILGNALLQLKQYPDALTALQRVIDLSPTSDVAEQALLAILQMHHKQKAYNSILTSYQYIFRHLPPSQSKWRPMSYLYAAEAYLEMNRVEEAKSIYEMILKVYPNDVSAFYAQDGLAWSYSYLGDDARALEERRKLKDLLQLAKSSSTMTGANELAIADSMFNQKEFEEAQELYQKYASENPKAPEAPQALYRAGMSLYHLRYFTDAISRWRQLCEAYPEAPESQKAVFQIADTLFRAQKFQEAVAAYRRIIEKYPDNDHLPLAFLRIAQAAFNSKDDAGTVRGCQALLDRFPTAPEAVDALDLMESALDRSPAMDFKQALGAVGLSSPRSAAAGDAQFRIARRLFEAKRFGEAASEFQKYSVDFTGGPHLKKAQFLLAEAYLNAGKNSEAVFAFQRFLDNFPKSEDTPLAVFHLAGAFYAQKEFDSAAQQYQRVLDDFPDSEYGKLALYNLALSYKAAGNSEKAQDAYSRYASQASGDPKAAMAALWEIFDLQKDQKKFGEALGTIERILNYGPDPETVIEATYQQGAVLILMNQPEDALRSWEKLLAMTPKASNYRLQGLIQLGEVYEQAKDWAKAVPVYDDISANASTPQMAKGAKDRADALRAMLQGKAAPSETVAPTAPPPAPPQPVKPPEAPPAADKKPPVKPAAAKKPAKAKKAKEPGTN